MTEARERIGEFDHAPGLDRRGRDPRPAGPVMVELRARVAEYDVARWVAIAAVVFIHASSFAVVRESVTVLGVMNRVARFGVPTFLFVAAALAWGRNAPLTWERWSGFMARRARLVLLPYAVWTLVYLAPELRVVGGVMPGLQRIAAALLTGDAAPHLYFVPLVTVVWLLSPLAGRLVGRFPAVAFLIGTALSLLTRFWVLDGGLVRTAVFGILLYLPTVLAGAWYDVRLPRSRELLARWWPLLVAAGVAGAAASAAGSLYWPLRWVVARPGWIRQETRRLEAAVESIAHVVTVAGVVGLSASLATTRARLADLARRWAPLVFGTYLAHAAVVFGILLAARRYAPDTVTSPIFVAILTLVGLAAGIGVTRLLAASHYTCWMVGVAEPWPLRPASAA